MAMPISPLAPKRFPDLPPLAGLIGKTIAEASIREKTGCSIIGIEQNGTTRTLPDPTMSLPEGGEMLLIGSGEAEDRFLELFGQRSARA